MFIAIAWAFKDEGDDKKDKSTWRKRLSKDEFLKLPRGTKERYIELYPHSSHRFLMGGKSAGGDFGEQMNSIVSGKKDIVQKVAEKRQRPTEEYMQKKAEERARIRRDIADHNKSNALVINKASLDAVNEVSDDDLKQVSTNVTRNAPTIVKAVKKQAEKQPHMYKRGLDVLKNLLTGTQNPEEQSITERHAAERVLTGVATMAIIGAGVLAAGVAAAPLGVLAGRIIFDMWSKGSGGKQLRDDIAHLSRERDKRRRKKLGVKDEFDFSEDKPDTSSLNREITDTELKKHKDILAKKKEGRALTDADKDFVKDINVRSAHQKRSKSKELAVAASQFEDHHDTINLIVEQVADILKYHTANDFKEGRDEMFSTASATAPNPHQQMEYLLTLAHCHGFKPSGDGLYFKGLGLNHVSNMFKGLGYSQTVENDGDNHVYLYQKENACVSIGACDGQYYVRYDGELR